MGERRKRPSTRLLQAPIIVRPGTCEASRAFTSTAKEEIEIGLGMKLRHDLAGETGKAKKGWKGLGLLVERSGGNLKNKSMKSAA